MSVDGYLSDLVFSVSARERVTSLHVIYVCLIAFAFCRLVTAAAHFHSKDKEFDTPIRWCVEAPGGYVGMCMPSLLIKHNLRRLESQPLSFAPSRFSFTWFAKGLACGELWS